jgi:ribonucleoside-diphosphate reductase beta chain
VDVPFATTGSRLTTRPAVHHTFRTTSPAGLDHSLLPMRLWHKAKQLGVWDPRAIDLSPDARDWQRLDAGERDLLLRLTSLFQAGEESVVLDLLPLILVIAREGRLEEEMYLTSFLWEEAKHVEAFRRFLDEVADEHTDLSRYHTPSYRRIFYEELPAAMERLHTDASPVAQAEASVTYNMIVEGVLAETGYRAYDALLQRNGIMPGMQEVIGHLRRDESRHLAYGIFLLSRLVAEHGEPVWDAIERRLEILLEPAMGTIAEIFAEYETMPFGLQIEEFTEFALNQFQARVNRLERARDQSLAQIADEVLAAVEP